MASPVIGVFSQPGTGAPSFIPPGQKYIAPIEFGGVGSFAPGGGATIMPRYAIDPINGSIPPSSLPTAPVVPTSPAGSRQYMRDTNGGYLNPTIAALENPASAGYDAAMAQLTGVSIAAPTASTPAASPGFFTSLEAWITANPLLAIGAAGLILYLLMHHSGSGRYR